MFAVRDLVDARYSILTAINVGCVLCATSDEARRGNHQPDVLSCAAGPLAVGQAHHGVGHHDVVVPRDEQATPSHQHTACEAFQNLLQGNADAAETARGVAAPCRAREQCNEEQYLRQQTG